MRLEDMWFQIPEELIELFQDAGYFVVYSDPEDGSGGEVINSLLYP
jgi:hypothetical protein